MIKNSILFLLIAMCLTACATFSNVTPLPPNSRVAIVTNLDNTLEFYSQSNPMTVFHHDYPTPTFDVNAAVLTSVKNAMTQAGLQVVSISYSPNTDDLKFDKNYLTNLAQKDNVQRIIFITKDIADYPSMPFNGYGFIKRSLFGLKPNINYISDIGFIVINTNDMQIRDYTTTWAGGLANADLLPDQPQAITPIAAQQLQNWMQATFTPKLISDMRRTGVF